VDVVPKEIMPRQSRIRQSPANSCRWKKDLDGAQTSAPSVFFVATVRISQHSISNNKQFKQQQQQQCGNGGGRGRRNGEHGNNGAISRSRSRALKSGCAKWSFCRSFRPFVKYGIYPFYVFYCRTCSRAGQKVLGSSSMAAKMT
jgi:hypothetical protein